MFKTFTLLIALPAIAAAQARPITVAQSGKADFRTVQEAVDSVRKAADSRHIIMIGNGTYRERLKIGKDTPNLTLRGSGGARIVFGMKSGDIDPVTGKKVGTSGCETVLIEGGGFTAENIVFENDAGDVGQAVAVRTLGDRAVFRSCRFIGWQDTLYANGNRHYFGDCHIEGRVDFIFGRATAVFERCTILSKNGGYVTAASTRGESPFGFVFLDCKLTSDGKTPTYLGRPWRPDAQVSFIRCELGSHIRPEGWHNWGKPENEKTARYSEYGSTGPGRNTSKRVPWSKLLTKDEAEKITIRTVLGGDDGWDPTAP